MQQPKFHRRTGDIDTIESTVSFVVAFENRAEEALDLIGGTINERDWQLVDANVPPDSLRAHIENLVSKR